jgi:hypothetical protein
VADDGVKLDVAAADSLTLVDAACHLLAGGSQQGRLGILDLAAKPLQSILICGCQLFEKSFGLTKLISQTHCHPPLPYGVLARIRMSSLPTAGSMVAKVGAKINFQFCHFSPLMAETGTKWGGLQPGRGHCYFRHQKHCESALRH